MAGDGKSRVFSQLKAREPRRVAFFFDYDRYQKQEAPAILFFVDVLRNLGHEVDFITSERELLPRVKDRRYDFLCISAFSISQLRDLFKTAIRAKKTDPFMISVMGGGATSRLAPQLAEAQGIDIVVEGEGEIVLPLILNQLKRVPGEDAEKAGLLEELPRHLPLDVDESLRDKFEEDALALLLADRTVVLPAVSKEQADRLAAATFRRTVDTSAGPVEVDVPVSGVFIRTAAGVIDTNQNLEAARARITAAWEREYPGSGFPLSPARLKRCLEPYPTDGELNELTGSYPWDIFTGKGYKSLGIYAQRGCNWGRCGYCSVDGLTGRRLAIPFLAKVLNEAGERGVSQVSFDDDQFIQNRKWVKELCLKIMEEKLDFQMEFTTMVKADVPLGRELLRLLKDANFTGLQIGVESFLPAKVAYFGKTGAGREQEYIDRAGRLIDDCLKQGIKPGVFIILARPSGPGALEEVAAELDAVMNIYRRAAETRELLPSFSFNDMLLAYPGAPLVESEEVRRFLAPLNLEVKQEGTARKLGLRVIEIPYMFKLKNMPLTSFVGNLVNSGDARKLPAGVLNRTIEHIEDAVGALEIAAAPLGSEAAAVFEFVRELGQGGSLETASGREGLLAGLAEKLAPGGSIDGDPALSLELHLVYRRLAPADVTAAVNDAGDRQLEAALGEEIPDRQRREQGQVYRRCEAVRNGIAFLKQKFDQDIQSFFARTRYECENLDGLRRSDAFAEEFAVLYAGAEKFAESYNFYLHGRENLQRLLDWMEEFATVGAPAGGEDPSLRPES